MLDDVFTRDLNGIQHDIAMSIQGFSKKYRPFSHHPFYAQVELVPG
jgi:hypothetical protein